MHLALVYGHQHTENQSRTIYITAVINGRARATLQKRQCSSRYFAQMHCVFRQTKLCTIIYGSRNTFRSDFGAVRILCVARNAPAIQLNDRYLERPGNCTFCKIFLLHLLDLVMTNTTIANTLGKCSFLRQEAFAILQISPKLTVITNLNINAKAHGIRSASTPMEALRIELPLVFSP